MLMVIPISAGAAKWQEISPGRVYEMLKEGSGLWLIDVRGKTAYDKLHIEGSVNISPFELALKRFPANKILVLADSSLDEMMAKEAADTLVGNGQKRVYVLQGGLKAWRKSSLPMIGDNPEWELSKVYPGELHKAEGSRNVKIFDLRGDVDGGVEVNKAQLVEGKTVEDRINKLKKVLIANRKDELVGKLQKPKTFVVLLPVATDSRELYRRNLMRLPEDIRVVDGGYLVSAGQRSKKTVTSGDGCSTCPGG
jgi:rhodanese-related sulfurtransferase